MFLEELEFYQLGEAILDYKQKEGFNEEKKMPLPKVRTSWDFVRQPFLSRVIGYCTTVSMSLKILLGAFNTWTVRISVLKLALFDHVL